MKQVILFIATSLDGFIAGKKGELDWLFTDADYGYKNFLASIDTTLMGYKTYEQVLSFGEFPYPNKKNYVFTRSRKKQDQNPVEFVSSDPAALVKKLKKESGKNIWLVGGGEINTILLNEGLIDEMIISIHPEILGEGIPLFAGTPKESSFELIKHHAYQTGLVQLHYKQAEH